MARCSHHAGSDKPPSHPALLAQLQFDLAAFGAVNPSLRIVMNAEVGSTKEAFE